MLVAWVFALHHIKIGLLQLRRDVAAAAIAYAAAIDFAYGGDFCGSAREKQFVCGVQFIARDALFNHAITQV